MTTKSKAKKQPLAAKSPKPGNTAFELVPHVQLVATSTKTPGSVTQADTEVVAPNICFAKNLLDVSGIGRTADNGQVRFRLTTFICRKDEFFHAPATIVATAFSATPCFLTVMHTILNHGTDVEITFFAWDTKGAPVGDMFFHWRCRVVLLRGPS